MRTLGCIFNQHPATLALGSECVSVTAFGEMFVSDVT